MRFVRVRRRPEVPAWAAALALLWLALLGVTEVLVHVSDAESHPPICIVRRVTGVPCPTCGSTRAVRAAIGGHPLRALALNPLMVLFGIAVLLWLVLRVGFGLQWQWGASVLARKALPWIIVAMFMANWVYVIWHESR